MKMIFTSKNWGLSLACALALGLLLCARPALAGTQTVFQETFDSANNMTWPATPDNTSFVSATLSGGTYDAPNWMYCCVHNPLSITDHRLARPVDDKSDVKANFENSFSSPVDMTKGNTLTISFDLLSNPVFPQKAVGQISLDLGPSTMALPGKNRGPFAHHYEIKCDPKITNAGFTIGLDNTNVLTRELGLDTDKALHVVTTIMQSATNAHVTLAVTGGGKYTLQSNTIPKILAAPDLLQKVNIHFAEHAVGWVDNLKIENTTSSTSRP